MTRTLFVTGTDTGVGKTHASCALIHALRASKRQVCGYKPIASGCVATAEGLRNADALALQEAAATCEPYQAINTYSYEAAIAPHLAAARHGPSIEVGALDAAHRALAARYDTIIVEGAGGWLLPIDAGTTLAGWVAAQGWPVVLVVGLRLGCLNHALLTVESIQRRTALVGWIANVLPPAPEEWQENLATLQARLSAPLLGCLPCGVDPHIAAAALNLQPLVDAGVIV